MGEFGGGGLEGGLYNYFKTVSILSSCLYHYTRSFLSYIQNLNPYTGQTLYHYFFQNLELNDVLSRVLCVTNFEP